MVYIITDDSGFIKIGKTVDLPKRMRQIQPGNPRSLHVLKTFQTLDDGLLEKALHWHFRHYKHDSASTWTNVSEWFSEQCLEEITQLEPEQLHDLMKHYSPSYSAHAPVPKINPDECWHSEYDIREMEKDNRYMRTRIERLKAANKNKQGEINKLKAELYDLKQTGLFT